MNEQGIAWMVTGSRHEASPEDLRYRELERSLRAERPRGWTLRERLAAAIGGSAAPTGAGNFAADCCAA